MQASGHDYILIILYLHTHTKKPDLALRLICHPLHLNNKRFLFKFFEIQISIAKCTNLKIELNVVCTCIHLGNHFADQDIEH